MNIAKCAIALVLALLLTAAPTCGTLALGSATIPQPTRAPLASPSQGPTLMPTPNPTPTPTPMPAPSPVPPGQSPQYLSIPLTRVEQKMVMPKNTMSYWFYLPDGVTLGNECSVTLHFTYSISFIQTLCSLTVHLNDIPLETYTFDEEGKREISWTITFDASLMKLGEYNEIRLDSVQRSIEGECADIDNPANWLVLHKDSALSFSCDPSLRPEVAEFYGLFMEVLSPPFAIEYDFALSNQNSANALSAMLGIASANGMHYPDRQYVNYRVLREPDLGQRNAVSIEEDPDSPGDQLTVSMEGAREGAPHYLIRIQGDSAQSFADAAAFFHNRTLMETIEHRSVTFTSKVAPQSARQVAELNDEGMYTFKDMGFTDIQLTGTFHHRASLSFVQPGGVRGEPGSYLDIRFRHSAALLSDRSQLTVLVNGVQIASTKLSIANQENGQLLVPIPEGALESPEIRVDFECYHYLGKVDCVKDYYDVAWTVIDAKASKICLFKGGQGVRSTLAGFPFFYGSEPSVRLYLPSEPGVGILECAATMAARTGQNTRIALDWRVVREELRGSEAPPPKGGTLVVFARRDQARLPPEVLDQLAIAPTANGWSIREDLALAPEALAGKVILQVVRSPWAFQQKLYLVLYDDEQNLSYLTQLLSDRSMMSALDGQLALIGKNGSVQAFTTDPFNPGTDKIPLGLTDYVKKVENYTNMSWWTLLAVVLAALVLLGLLLGLIRRKHDEYKRAVERHKDSQGFDERKSDGDDDEQ